MVAHARGDVSIYERVQWRVATKLIPEAKHLYYEGRLLKCRLTTLETRRLIEDQIAVFMMLNGKK